MPYAKPYRSILIHRGEVEKRGYHIKRDKLMLMYRAAVGRWEEESLLCPIQLFNYSTRLFLPRATAATIVGSKERIIQYRVNEKCCHQHQVKLILISIMTLKTFENLNTLSIIVSLCFIYSNLYSASGIPYVVQISIFIAFHLWWFRFFQFASIYTL